MSLARYSKRQKRLYGLHARSFPHYMRDEMELDAQYRADLAKDPAAARWLSAFNEETLKGIRIRGECHALDYDTWREANAARVRKQRNKDPVAFHGMQVRVQKTVVVSSEDEVIEKLDTDAAVRLRKETDDGSR